MLDRPRQFGDRGVHQVRPHGGGAGTPMANRKGLIREPPPTPVSPTRNPIKRPKRISLNMSSYASSPRLLTTLSTPPLGNCRRTILASDPLSQEHLPASLALRIRAAGAPCSRQLGASPCLTDGSVAASARRRWILARLAAASNVMSTCPVINSAWFFAASPVKIRSALCPRAI